MRLLLRICSPTRLRIALTVAISVVLTAPLFADPSSLELATKLLNTGKYAEAGEAFDQLKDSTPHATLGKSRCLSSVGKVDEAVALLVDAQKKHTQSEDIPSELAQLAFDRGDWKTAKRYVDQTLSLDKNHLGARYLQGELARAQGDLNRADAAYKWLVDYYNDKETAWTADQLHTIGLAAAQYARWNRLSDQFSFLVNDLYPEAIRRDPTHWRSHLESARLFLEKYNRPDAHRELLAALRINPQAAEVHVALAELALQTYKLDEALSHIRRAQEINPNLLSARLALADVHLANFDQKQAAKILEEARPLNPQSEALLGRLAAAWGLIEGLPPIASVSATSPDKQESSDSRLEQLIAQVTKQNAHPGEFYLSLASSLDLSRRYPAAGAYFEKTIEAMPQLVGPRGQLGLVHLRLGEEDEARRVLTEAFRIDPFNVRVSNSLKVLDVLKDYDTLETDHFLIRYDPKKDRVLARAAANYLEQIYPELCQRLGYTLPEKALFELFHDAQGSTGHNWFSARMVGLPNIHTIGACAGKVVALTSPTSMRSKVNWARVLRHEFVHVINLQQTDFNIPHWFTEALAVHCEDQPRPREWNKMLIRRVKEGKVFDLSDINLAFIRPSSSEDWQMAYCQAEIYADYLVATYGADSLSKMLAAYRENLSTTEAIETSFQVEIADFEKGYTDYLKQVVADLPAGLNDTKRTLAELKQANAADPSDLDIAAELAQALLRRRQSTKAGELADTILQSDPKHQLATYVRAKLLTSIGQASAAKPLLEQCLDREAPQPDALKLLGAIAYRESEFDQAGDYFRLGAEHFPGDPSWTKSLALVYLKQKDETRLIECLQQMAAEANEDVVVRRKLAALAKKRGDHAAAARWANEVIQIDVLDTQMHVLRATSLRAKHQHQEAAAAYELATMLRPRDLDLRLALAKSYQASNNLPEAKRVAQQILELSPEGATNKSNQRTNARRQAAQEILESQTR